MEKHGPEPEDDLLPEYDLATLKGGVRGKYWLRYQESEASRPPAQGEPASIPVTCRCGQPFNVHIGTHPAKVSCHVCGHKMIVAQHGNTVHLTNCDDEGPAEIDEERVDTAICEMPPTAVSTAITLPSHLEAFAASASATEPGDQLALDNELKKIDLDWQIEQLKFRVAWPWCERSVLIANVVCLLLFLLVGALAIYLLFRGPGDMWLLCIGIQCVPAIIAFCRNALFWDRQRTEYRQAEAEYQQHRRAAFERFSGL